MAIQERGKISRDRVVKSLVEGDFQNIDPFDMVSRRPEVLALPILVRLMEGTMVGYATRLSVLVTIAVVWDILQRIAPVPVDLGHPLPQQKDLFRVLPPEVHSQLVEAEAEVGAVPQAVRAQLISQSKVVL